VAIVTIQSWPIYEAIFNYCELREAIDLEVGLHDWRICPNAGHCHELRGVENLR
jgi:hypothetical protein